MAASKDIKVTNVFIRNKDAVSEGWPIICNEGGSRSSKSYSIIQLLVLIANNTPKTRISIVSHSLPHIKRGAFRDLKQILEDFERWFVNREEGLGSGVFLFADSERCVACCFSGADAGGALSQVIFPGR